MPTNFPTSLDAFTNPTSADNLDTVGVLHDVEHADKNDAIEAIEAKVGINGSAVATSIDNKLAQIIQGSVSLTDDTVGATGSFGTWDPGAQTVMANPGRAISILAWLSGYASNGSATDEVASAKVDISFDGGTTWDEGKNVQENISTGIGQRGNQGAHHFKTGTPTGTVQVRAQIRQTNGTAGDITWAQGRLSWQVVFA